MSQQTPTEQRTDDELNQEMPEGALPGQIVQPNPLEIFWEKNRKQIIGGIVVILAIFGGMRLWQEMQRRQRNELWTKYASSLGFTKVYVPSDVQAFDLFSFAYKPYREFGTEIDALPVGEIEQAASDLGGTPAANLARWVLVHRHVANGEVEKAQSVLDEISKAAPKDPGLVSRAYPPIYLEVPEATKPGEEPEPEEPAAQSLRDIALARAKRIKEFRSANKHLYEAPTPDEKPEVVFETSSGTIKVRLYQKQAPKHCKQFLENCEKGIYNGLRFHQIQRRGNTTGSPYEGDLAFLGDPESKNDDKTKWGQFRSKEEIEHEVSGISHFPFMLAADRDPSKINSDSQLIYFTASDCSERRDDQYVVFGRVVEGEEILTTIVKASMSQTSEESVGKGKPASATKVEKVTVTK